MPEDLEQFGQDVLSELQAPAVEQPEQEQTEESVQTVQRDEQGRFVKKEEGELILGKFRDSDEVVRAYQEAERKIGQMGSELGELRKLAEQIQQAPQQQQQVPLTQETVDWFDEQVQENPYAAAEWARYNDPSGALYNRAVESWYDLAPRDAARYERHLENQQMWGWMEQRFGSAIQPLAERASVNDFASAWASVSQRIPDLNAAADAILEVAQQAPEFATRLESGTFQDKERAIENLYYLARGRQASAPEGGQAPSQDQARRQAAFVATGSQVQEPETKTPQEKWLEEVFDPAASEYYSSDWPS